MIAGFEARATQDGQTPVKYLFLDWSRSDNAIVSTLIRALKGIGREDIIKVLCGDTRDYAPAPRYILPSSLQNIKEMPGQMV